MFGFNWFLRRFQNRGRRIFQYWDGSRSRRCDPMVATRLLESHEQFEWETTPKLIDAPDRKISDEAAAITADAVRLAFGISEYDGRAGLTEGELISLLVDFSVFLSAVKKNTSDSDAVDVESEGSES